MLGRVFGTSKVSDGLPLDERQRRVLGALVDNEGFWDRQSGNLSLVMQRIGLENDRALVRRAIAGGD